MQAAASSARRAGAARGVLHEMLIRWLHAVGARRRAARGEVLAAARARARALREAGAAVAGWSAAAGRSRALEALAARVEGKREAGLLDAVLDAWAELLRAEKAEATHEARPEGPEDHNLTTFSLSEDDPRSSKCPPARPSSRAARTDGR